MFSSQAARAAVAGRQPAMTAADFNDFDIGANAPIASFGALRICAKQRDSKRRRRKCNAPADQPCSSVT
jgi:hypothetical protein